MLTIKEVSEKLRVTDRTLRNWIKTGYIKSYRIGKQIMFKESDIDEFINKNENKGE